MKIYIRHKHDEIFIELIEANGETLASFDPEKGITDLSLVKSRKTEWADKPVELFINGESQGTQIFVGVEYGTADDTHEVLFLKRES